MAAEAKVKIDVLVEGLGDDKQVHNRSLVSDTPTKAFGPFYTVIGSGTTQVDVVSIVSGQLLGVYIKAAVSNVYINPIMSTPITTCGNYLSQGQADFYSYSTSLSALPWVAGAGGAAAIEYLVYGIT